MSIKWKIIQRIFLGGVFDCFNDVGICFYGWCCPPCLYGKNAEKIDGSSCCCQACAWCLLAPFGLCCLIHTGKRESLRRRYDLPQDWNDCVATTFFPTCTICQEARELKFRAAAPAGIYSY